MGWMAPDGIDVPGWWSSKITSNGSHPRLPPVEAALLG
jgi:hypothetical protein